MYDVGAKKGTDTQQIAKLGAEGEVVVEPDDRQGDQPVVPGGCSSPEIRFPAHTSLGWDPIVGTVVPPDEFWDKATRNVKKFRTKIFEYFQQMAEIIENCCATGALSRASTQGALDSDEEDEMLNKFWNPEVGGSNAAEAIPVNLFSDEYMDLEKGKSYKRGPTSSQTDSGRSKKSRSSGFDDVCTAFTSYVQAKTEHSHTRENETEAVSAGSDKYSLDACQDALLELGDIQPV
ncbi:uncharacterized protein At2g29880-like [Camellia sinensis]|uniref:uncharacterized protein At2g29880-like n=1 Tax=Camellia sinensis TaxID=4442 RepID=UPI0010365484|nr:uncharacterized protein At2g29880-like [Camellia sinensis]